MALDLTLKNRKRALEKENENSFEKDTISDSKKPITLEESEKSSPRKSSHDHFKKLAIANWTWSKYKTCKRKIDDLENEDGSSSPKRISPDLPRGDHSTDEACPVSPAHLTTSTPPASPGYVTSQRVLHLPPLLSPAYLLPRGHTSLIMSPPASPGYLPARACHIFSPTPVSPLGCLPSRSHVTTPCSPISPSAAAASSSPMVRTAPASTRRDGVFFAALPDDPRDWNRADVYCWLRYMKETHSIEGLQYDRFLMNGKALCLMNVNMFQYRVPKAGKLLYRDFKLRLSRALQKEAASRPQRPQPTATVTNAASASA